MNRLTNSKIDLDKDALTSTTIKRLSLVIQIKAPKPCIEALMYKHKHRDDFNRSALLK